MTKDDEGEWFKHFQLKLQLRRENMTFQLLLLKSFGWCPVNRWNTCRETNFCVLLKYTQAASGLFLSSLLFLLDVSPCEPAHPETVLLNIFHFSPLPPVTFLCLSTHGSLSSLWSLVSYWPVLSWGGRVSVLADCALRHPVCGAADFSFLPEEENVND